VTMNVLIVYSAGTFQVDSQIEGLREGGQVEVIEPGERELAPGVYRFSDDVQVASTTPHLGESEIQPIADLKKPWPDPPLAARLTSALGLTSDELRDFAGGANVESDLG